ncbi:hypothetical protein [Streptomyces griseomycini]|uniref:Uncharacterized protein n=1 Tax=Streptomyces griseomycini TaxID=66895 RepID=A0A7W7PWE6_9ACTN|nr:hypothetical protein [Streptomyces griseomycini]MBB4902514.1 hypothetical protein [Streptomyces griseomycini]GGR52152.1 hypothetical protein GCM10015536_67060 [Streptomyces griseomycini]
MAGTTRTRKTAAAKAAETAAAAEETTPAEPVAPPAEETAPATDSSPKAPDAAPLEPPAVQEPPAAPEAPVYATPTEVIPDDENLSEVIIDDATKEPPADVAGVFVPLTEYGSVLVCTVRLVEKTYLGPHRNPVHRLLQPKGAHVSEGVAARIRERLEAQAARLAVQADDAAGEQ